MKKQIYLAGALGCYTVDESYPYDWRDKVIEYFEMYLPDEFKCFDPTEHYRYYENKHKTEKEVMRYDLRALKNSDVVLVDLKNLHKSLGTSDEILYAYLHGIPVIGFYESDSEEEIENLHPWKIEQIDRIEIGKNAMSEAMDYIADYYF